MGNTPGVKVKQSAGSPIYMAPVHDREAFADGSESASHLYITPVAQITHVTPANVEIDDEFAILYGGVAIAEFTATGATVKNVVEGLKAAWETGKVGVTGAEDITATEDDLKVILTADNTGVPFTVTATAVDGGVADTQTLTVELDTGQSVSGFDNVVEHVTGTEALEFDKVSGPDEEAGIYWGVDSLDITRFLASDKIEICFYVSDVTDIAEAKIILGTDISNHMIFTVDDSEMANGWNCVTKYLYEGTTVGNGWDTENIAYGAFYVTFDAITDLLADVRLDSIVIKSV